MFRTINNMYTSFQQDWIKTSPASSVVVMKFLGMNKELLPLCRKLDRYTFKLENTSMLSLINSQMPKEPRAPFIKYIKSSKENAEEFLFILDKVQNYFNYSDKEFEGIKYLVLDEIKKDMRYWFDFYGVDEKHYRKHKVELTKVKKIKEVVKPLGLSAFM